MNFQTDIDDLEQWASTIRLNGRENKLGSYSERVEKTWAFTKSLTCHQRMELTYYTLQSEFNSIIMSKEWYTKCFHEFGCAFNQWNGLKVFLDPDLLCNYAFLQKKFTPDVDIDS